VTVAPGAAQATAGAADLADAPAPARAAWPSPDLPVRVAQVVAAAAALALVLRTWLPPLSSSFWLDELGTVWLTRGSLAETLGRTGDYQGGAPLYYLLLWPVRQLAGVDEAALRSLSVVGMLATTGLVVLLGRRLFGLTTGVVAGVVFLALPMTAFAAVDARPYALALATSAGHALALLAWQDTGRRRFALLQAAAFAATVYLHYLYVPALVAHALFALHLRSAVPWRRRLLLPYGAAAVLLLPGIPLFLRVLGDRGVLSNPYGQSAVQVVEQVLPAVVAGTLLAGVLVLALLPRRPAADAATTDAVVFVLAWACVPLLALVAVTQWTSSDVLLPRYLSSVLPAVALLLAVAVTRLGPSWAHLLVAAALALTVLDQRGPVTTHTGEDWRAAAEAERLLVESPDTPVLLFSGLIEADQPDWLEDPERASYLSAPAAGYPLDGRVLALPFSVNPRTEPYLQRIVAEMGQQQRFVLLTRSTDPYNGYLLERLQPLGFSSRQVVDLGQIRLYEFSR
jgi:mannosyltransferase